MFLQPDWWEVMQEGVGTNRYSYSFNDPVNGRDPSGHFVPALVGGVIAGVEYACAGGGCQALAGAAIAVGIDLWDNGLLDGSVLADPIGEALGLANTGGGIAASTGSGSSSGPKTGNKELDDILSGEGVTGDGKKGISYPGSIDDLEKAVRGIKGASEPKPHSGGGSIIEVPTDDGTGVIEVNVTGGNRTSTGKPGVNIRLPGDAKGKPRYKADAEPNPEKEAEDGKEEKVINSDGGN